MLANSVVKYRQFIRLVQWAFLGLFVATFVIFYVHFLPRRKSFSIEGLPYCQAVPKTENVSTNFTVLLWTTYFNTNNNPNFDDSKPDNCPYTNCDFSKDLNIAEEADALVFHEADVDMKALPTTRSQRQKWILFNQESPPNSHVLSNHFDGLFNWSMTYSHMDDVVVPYFEMCLDNKTTQSEPEIEDDEKMWAAVWFVSDCRTPSHRMAYVEELQKYMSIDIIGACSPQNIQCSKHSHKQCMDMFLPRYKFVLAFENSICTDYVTEKLQNVLPYDIVPIFWGGVDYGMFLPRESFVVASDYPNPKDLAKALFRFRDNNIFRRTVSHRKGILAREVNWKCRLCEKLNKSMSKYSVRHRLYYETVKNARCKTWRRGAFSEQIYTRRN